MERNIILFYFFFFFLILTIRLDGIKTDIHQNQDEIDIWT